MRPDLWKTGVGLVSAVVFHNHGLRPAGSPLGGIDFWQVNLRAYVRRGGVPGVWFFRMYLDRYAPVLLEAMASAVVRHVDLAFRRMGSSTRLLVTDHSRPLLWTVVDETAPERAWPSHPLIGDPGDACDPGDDCDPGDACGPGDLGDFGDLRAFVVDRPVGWFRARWGGIGEIRVDHASIPVRPVVLRDIEAPVWDEFGLRVSDDRRPGRDLDLDQPIAMAATPVRLSIHLPARARTPVWKWSAEPRPLPGRVLGVAAVPA